MPAPRAARPQRAAARALEAAPRVAEAPVVARAADPAAAKKRKFKFFFVYIGIFNCLHLIILWRCGLGKSQRFLFTYGAVLGGL